MGEDNKGHEAAGRNKSVCFSLEEAVPGGGAVCRSPAGTLQEHFRNVLGTLDLNDRMAQTAFPSLTSVVTIILSSSLFQEAAVSEDPQRGCGRVGRLDTTG